MCEKLGLIPSTPQNLVRTKGIKSDQHVYYSLVYYTVMCIIVCQDLPFQKASSFIRA